MIKPSKRLKTVLKLAKLHQQQAAERLGEKVRLERAQQQQMQQLESYQKDYNSHFVSQGKQPVNPSQLRNYLLFFNSLENAIKTQIQRKALVHSELAQSRSDWQQMYSRQKNMESLINRKKQQEERESENKLQRTLDDRVIPDKEIL